MYPDHYRQIAGTPGAPDVELETIFGLCFGDTTGDQRRSDRLRTSDAEHRGVALALPARRARRGAPAQRPGRCRSIRDIEEAIDGTVACAGKPSLLDRDRRWGCRRDGGKGSRKRYRSKSLSQLALIPAALPQSGVRIRI
jgi:hypothetical protein